MSGTKPTFKALGLQDNKEKPIISVLREESFKNILRIGKSLNIKVPSDFGTKTASDKKDQVYQAIANELTNIPTQEDKQLFLIGKVSEIATTEPKPDKPEGAIVVPGEDDETPPTTDTDPDPDPVATDEDKEILEASGEVVEEAIQRAVGGSGGGGGGLLVGSFDPITRDIEYFARCLQGDFNQWRQYGRSWLC